MKEENRMRARTISDRDTMNALINSVVEGLRAQANVQFQELLEELQNRVLNLDPELIEQSIVIERTRYFTTEVVTYKPFVELLLLEFKYWLQQKHISDAYKLEGMNFALKMSGF